MYTLLEQKYSQFLLCACFIVYIYTFTGKQSLLLAFSSLKCRENIWFSVQFLKMPSPGQRSCCYYRHQQSTAATVNVTLQHLQVEPLIQLALVEFITLVKERKCEAVTNLCKSINFTHQTSPSKNTFQQAWFRSGPRSVVTYFRMTLYARIKHAPSLLCYTFCPRHSKVWIALLR